MSHAKNILSSLILAVVCNSAIAVDLLGSTLSFRRAYPTIGTPYGLPILDTIVTNGSSDERTWSFSEIGNIGTIINPEADRIIFSFPPKAQFVSTDTRFDGFVISGFNFDIANISLMNDSTSMLVKYGTSSDSRQIFVALNGISVPGSSFALVLSAVPESSIAFQLMAGIIVLGCVGRRDAAKHKGH